MLGLRGRGYTPHVTEFKVRVDRDGDQNYVEEVVEHFEDFVIDSNYYAETRPDYDASGNLTYDGVFSYTYDAWNRLVKATKAYKDDTSPYALNEGGGYVSMSYDGVGRRIGKEVRLGGDDPDAFSDVDTSYAYYYDGQQQVEVRDGSDNVLKQQVWGLMYIDELIQIGVNDDPTDGLEDDVETYYYTLHNANFNVMGLVDSSGDMVERYEYTPYGERQVFYSSGINDPGALTPRHMSQRVQDGSGDDRPYALNEFGHQGLYHDEELGLIYNRFRMTHPRFGRFMQRDPLGYPDGTNSYAAYHIMMGGVDPSGLRKYGQKKTDDSVPTNPNSGGNQDLRVRDCSKKCPSGQEKTVIVLGDVDGGILNSQRTGFTKVFNRLVNKAKSNGENVTSYPDGASSLDMQGIVIDPCTTKIISIRSRKQAYTAAMSRYPCHEQGRSNP